MRWPTRSRAATRTTCRGAWRSPPAGGLPCPHGRGGRRLFVRRRGGGDPRKMTAATLMCSATRRRAAPAWAKGIWVKDQAEEKAGKRAARLARGLDPEDHGKAISTAVPLAFPPSQRALKLQERRPASASTGRGPRPSLRQDRVRSAKCARRWRQATRPRPKTSSANVLFALVNFGRHLKLDP